MKKNITTILALISILLASDSSNATQKSNKDSLLDLRNHLFSLKQKGSDDPCLNDLLKSISATEINRYFDEWEQCK